MVYKCRKNFISLEFKVIYGTLVNTKNFSEFSTLPSSASVFESHQFDEESSNAT